MAEGDFLRQLLPALLWLRDSSANVINSIRCDVFLLCVQVVISSKNDPFNGFRCGMAAVVVPEIKFPVSLFTLGT